MWKKAVVISSLTIWVISSRVTWLSPGSSWVTVLHAGKKRANNWQNCKISFNFTYFSTDLLGIKGWLDSKLCLFRWQALYLHKEISNLSGTLKTLFNSICNSVVSLLVIQLYRNLWISRVFPLFFLVPLFSHTQLHLQYVTQKELYCVLHQSEN